MYLSFLLAYKKGRGPDEQVWQRQIRCNGKRGIKPCRRTDDTSRINDLIHKREEDEKKKNCILWVLAIIGAVAAVAGIAYAVYRFFTPDYLEDFEDDFDDDFDDDFFEDEKAEEKKSEKKEEKAEEKAE